MAVPIKNGVIVLLTQYGRLHRADLYKINDVYVFVMNSRYIYPHEAGIDPTWHPVDVEVHIDKEDIYRRAEDNGGLWDVLIIREQMATFRPGFF